MSITCISRLTFVFSSLMVFKHSFVFSSAKSGNAVGFGKLMPTELRLGDPCKSSYECLHHLHHSHCDWDSRVCTCQPYHVQFNDTFCLPASLLGYGCATDEQCQIKVKESECSERGLCRCKPNRIPLRKDKCLPPAEVGDFCLNDQQCRLASVHSYCHYIIPRIYGKCNCPHGFFLSVQNQCLPHLGSQCQSNEECQAVTEHSSCQWLGSRSECRCVPGYDISANGLTCQKQNAQGDSSLWHEKPQYTVPSVSLGKPCLSSSQCKSRDPNSDCIQGRCECVVDTDRCSSRNTGCANDTFQCANGQCISWYFVCDGEQNCIDGSDENLCIPFACPSEAFQCNDGTCMSRSVVCNGRWECPDGSDEARCYKGIPCDRNSFRCSNGQCLPQYSFCNAVTDCYDGSDENYDTCERVLRAASEHLQEHREVTQATEEGTECPPDSFRCGNGRCRSTAILCSGLDGCGDNSDEINCEVCYCQEV